MTIIMVWIVQYMEFCGKYKKMKSNILSDKILILNGSSGRKMTTLKIEIIGTENTLQKMLLINVKEALRRLCLDGGKDVNIVTITDWEDIIHYDIIQTPVLVIRKQVISQGFLPSAAELQRIIAAFLPDEHNELKLKYKE